MPEYVVVVVEPKFEGNIGAIARVMKNFGSKDMRLVNPCDIGDEAWQRSMHAEDVLDARKTYGTLKEAVEDCSYVVGTSGSLTTKEKAFVRIPMMPWELANQIGRAEEGKVALVFGRENWGLYNEELALCDALVNIPTNPDYPILNLSHAVGILLYELSRDTEKDTKPKIRLASGHERETLYKFFDELLEAEKYPVHRREKTSTMFRRIVGRAVLTKWEFHTFSGVLRTASNHLRNPEGPWKLEEGGGDSGDGEREHEDGE
ncbi:MAG: RNA methyltransferase [Candidatus Thermoplasmatota archaeon]|nr:RNA methyltransferase [Candidatus Thermoplasmatota archaeon]